MTLVELLISISIMVLIIGTVAGVIAFMVRSTSPTSVTSAQANDVMLASAYFAQDVAHAQYVGLTAPTPANCSNVTIAGTTIAWLYYKPGSTYTNSIVYSYSGNSLVRTDCTSGSQMTILTSLTTPTPALQCLFSNATPTACGTDTKGRRTTSTGLQVVLALGRKTTYAGSVTTSVTLNGAWMISG